VIHLGCGDEDCVHLWEVTFVKALHPLAHVPTTVAPLTNDRVSARHLG
jgi:hypothetical protein